MKKVALQEVRDELPRYLRLAEDEDVVITEDGRPTGVLIGFRSDEDWEDYQLENDPRFLARVEESRRDFREGRVTRLEDIKD
ncbi:MAG TPA: type II toxin-antitoxin system prevent-host-death family antitoxin [Thermoanaerobaculia bacterium]|jgi:prevent-host-death family protein|nr:type II toxin-antitoxin system prevent-host-death family antitoxin [Thermoanaerobaculia bacterium]